VHLAKYKKFHRKNSYTKTSRSVQMLLTSTQELFFFLFNLFNN